MTFEVLALVILFGLSFSEGVIKDPSSEPSEPKNFGQKKFESFYNSTAL